MWYNSGITIHSRVTISIFNSAMNSREILTMHMNGQHMKQVGLMAVKH